MFIEHRGRDVKIGRFNYQSYDGAITITLLQKTFYDYLDLMVFVPFFVVKSYEDDYYYKTLQISLTFNTELFYKQQDDYIFFKIQFLGFGIGFRRQKGY